MTYDELLQRARRTEVLQDEATVEPAVKAVLGIMASRLNEAPARKFCDVLPGPLTYETLRGQQANVTNITAEQYIQSVAQQFNMQKDRAERLITSLVGAVTTDLPEDVLTAMKNDLPSDWQRFLQKK